MGNTRSPDTWPRPPPVHPHARGEHKTIPSKHPARNGSSPRPWGTLSRATPGSPLPTVHPHARGEHASPDPLPPSTRGSSPRPWGTRCRGITADGEERFIPTPVGNTLFFRLTTVADDGSSPRPWGTQASSASLIGQSAVHPHARGEHPPDPDATARQAGSSPRPWGTQPRRARVDHNGRFIPTPVGNTVCGTGRTCVLPVHPHARGEHIGEGEGRVEVAGSSPRPWGTPIPAHSVGGQRRFIPTPVGNTWPCRRCRWPWPVHPHARGEHRAFPSTSSTAHGSSPRPWGTPSGRMGYCPTWRFIPTPVGNTSKLSPVDCSFAVHPHARGEHEADLPRVVQRQRFIPTPVGNTSAPWRASWPRPVHPHARGEHTSGESRRMRRSGSSPRPWGTRDGRRDRADRGVGSSPRPWGTRSPRPRSAAGSRFIPTPVGNTDRPPR